MYRSPLLLLYFWRNSLAILVWPLSQIARPVISVIFIGLLTGLAATSAAAQNTQANTEPASPFGLSARQGTVIVRPVAVSVAVRRSLFDHPAMQAGRARTCQALYRLGLNRAEARPQISGSISGQRQLFGHYKSSNNTDKDSAEARGVSERELNVYDVEVNLRPENVADVYLGQEARISLSAYDVSRYGSLAGVVQNVASNTTEREGQPPFYETIINVPDPVFTKTGQLAEIIPGMTVVVDIIGGKRTVLDYILTPINKATSVAFREN